MGHKETHRTAIVYRETGRFPSQNLTFNLKMAPIVNIAAYKFVALANLEGLRRELLALAERLQLRGSILLSMEGINLFVAGSREGIDTLLDRVRQIPGVSDLEVKESLSEQRPFNRMLVKIKKEIIAFDVPGIDPKKYSSRRVSARELKNWLDEGRPVTLLDTRNNFEIKVGTFQNARAIDLEDFRDFPKAVDRLPEELKQQTIVTFCTGGIRCEKAAPYLEREGFRDVYQLDGGILKYFEECGSEHYQGHCFVFDKRVAVDAELKECSVRQCFNCWAVLSAEDLESPNYIEGKSCPNCFRPASPAGEQLIELRRNAIQEATKVLPGSLPYENVRPISVPLRFDGLEVLDFLDAMKTHLTREEWQRACADGRLICREEHVQPGRVVRSGERLLHTMPATREPDVNAAIEILHEDDALVAISKPAPLPMHPCGRFNRNSLTYILNQVYRPLRLLPVHRLDADTTGVVIFARNREVARTLQERFEAGSMHKTYLARVLGHPIENVFESNEPVQSQPGPNGIRLPDANGISARTRFHVLGRLRDGTALLEVDPLSGRTNQIRVHLWSFGIPIVGDPMYLQIQQLGTTQGLSINDPPLCLHAKSIEFDHPLTGLQIRFEAPVPSWGMYDEVRK